MYNYILWDYIKSDYAFKRLRDSHRILDDNLISFILTAWLECAVLIYWMCFALDSWLGGLERVCHKHLWIIKWNLEKCAYVISILLNLKVNSEATVHLSLERGKQKWEASFIAIEFEQFNICLLRWILVNKIIKKFVRAGIRAQVSSATTKGPNH